MADSKKKKKSNVNGNKSANKKGTSKKSNTTNKNNKKVSVSTKKVTTKKKPTTKKSNTKSSNVKKNAPKKKVSVSTKKVTTKKKPTTKKSTTKKVKVETKSVSTKKKSTTKKTTPKKKTQISTTSVKVSPEQIDALTTKVEDKKVVKIKNVNDTEKVKDTSNLEPVKKVTNSRKAKTTFKDSEQEKSTKIIEEAFKEEEKEEIIAREVSEAEKPILLESYDLDNVKNSNLNMFLGRLISLILILILSIFLIMNFTVKYMTNSSKVDISYYESSDISYNLCSGENCSGELQDTNSSIDKANVSLKYDAHFDEKIKYDITYSVIYKFEIFDDTKTYSSNSTQVDSKKISEKKDNFIIDLDNEINLAEYRDKLKKYNEEKNKECSGSISAILKVKGIEGTKNVATLYIPLGDGEVDKTIISSNMGDALFANSKSSRWGGTYVVMMIICFIVIVIACVGIIMLLNTNYDPLDEE